MGQEKVIEGTTLQLVLSSEDPIVPDEMMRTEGTPLFEQRMSRPDDHGGTVLMELDLSQFRVHRTSGYRGYSEINLAVFDHRHQRFVESVEHCDANSRGARPHTLKGDWQQPSCLRGAAADADLATARSAQRVHFLYRASQLRIDRVSMANERQAESRGRRSETATLQQLNAQRTFETSDAL
jgi:hypothetical protein